MKIFVVAAVLFIVASNGGEGAPQFAPSLDFSFTTSHNPQKPTLVVDNSTVEKSSVLQENETLVEEIALTESNNSISDIQLNIDEPIPSLSELDNAHVLTKEVTTEKPVYSNVEIQATRVKSPQETDTYVAYQQFLNTWLHLASINLNRPDLRNLISPIIVTSPKVLPESEVTTQSSTVDSVSTSTSITTTVKQLTPEVTTSLPEAKPISTETIKMQTTTPSSSDMLVTDETLIKSDIMTEEVIQVKPTTKNVPSSLSTTTESVLVENKTETAIENNEGQITEIILDFGHNITQNEEKPAQNISTEKNLNSSQTKEAVITSPEVEQTSETIVTPLIQKEESIDTGSKKAKSLLGNEASNNIDPIDNNPVASKSLNSNIESLQANVPAAFSAIPIQYPGGFRYTISHSPVRGSFFFTSPLQG